MWWKREVRDRTNSQCGNEKGKLGEGNVEEGVDGRVVREKGKHKMKWKWERKMDKIRKSGRCSWR